MILLDTHVWVWWVHGDASLPAPHRALLDAAEETGIAVSAISCWEVAKLVERGRLALPCPVFDWASAGAWLSWRSPRRADAADLR
ncbi:MAG: hypothetical protein RLZZ265_1964 [Verrucomicrobiota bacterium]